MTGSLGLAGIYQIPKILKFFMKKCGRALAQALCDPIGSRLGLWLCECVRVVVSPRGPADAPISYAGDLP